MFGSFARLDLLSLLFSQRILISSANSAATTNDPLQRLLYDISGSFPERKRRERRVMDHLLVSTRRLRKKNEDVQNEQLDLGEKQRGGENLRMFVFWGVCRTSGGFGGREEGRREKERTNDQRTKTSNSKCKVRQRDERGSGWMWVWRRREGSENRERGKRES